MFLIQASFIFFLNSYNHNAKNYKKKFHHSHIFVFSQSICFYNYQGVLKPGMDNFFYSTCNKLQVHFQLLPKILPAGYTCTSIQINLRICNQLYSYLYQSCRFEYRRFSLAVPRYVICSFNFNFLQHLKLRSPIQHPTCHEHLYQQKHHPSKLGQDWTTS